ncbi:uncharacterized protein [Triticum aestivum]|uniref:uncharacterized protein isoform X2 n=1 Tax=Triticum aestivum TaxID=4565 RepID=UPI001D018E13|nr:uncharacterized protein LOC123094001 isoform X2 [Triticum aestivum]
MDRSWMRAARSSAEYSEGTSNFIQFAFRESAKNSRILCPCKICVNSRWLGEHEVYDHLICDGFMSGYTIWIHHGESMRPSEAITAPSSQFEEYADSDEMDEMLLEGFGMYDTHTLGEEQESEDDLDDDAEAYYRLVNDGHQELYPGCKRFSKLQFLVRLLHIKNMRGMSNVCFDEVLTLIKEALPEGQALPKNFHGAKKFMKAIGIGYDSIDACKNDCILFRKEHADAISCPVCGTSRWKSVNTGVDGRRVHKVPQKVVRHFPLKKRLQRLFASTKTTSDMRWHSEGRTKDGLIRHPAGSPAWKHFDAIHKDFSSEVCNVRFGLGADGFNPFGNMNLSYSIWPIVLIPYNLPPWICMKQSNFILSIIIPGKKSPGKDMDVYMQLTIDDLLELWNDGVWTYDASRSKKFLLRAALLWTISDWPGRGSLSGENIAVCSHCLSETCSLWLKNGHKKCYMGHRRFLEPNHEFRFDAESFDGFEEHREPPVPLSSHDISVLTKDMKTTYGKLQQKSSRKRHRNQVDENDASMQQDTSIFRKRSCFFQLPYWETLLLRHNLDPMHIEKNVFENMVMKLNRKMKKVSLDKKMNMKKKRKFDKNRRKHMKL